MHKPSPLQKLALLSAIWMALVCLHTRANAQETTTFNIYARISNTTCLLKMSDTNGSQTGGTKTVTLPTVNSSSGSQGSPLGSPVTIQLSLVLPANTNAPCYSPPATGQRSNNWDIALLLDQSQIISINDKTYLKNALSNGSDAVVLLKGSTVGTSAQNLNLKIGDSTGYGTLVSGSNSVGSDSSTNVGITQTLQLVVQLTQAGTNAPKAGLWKQTIPLMVVYQ